MYHYAGFFFNKQSRYFNVIFQVISFKYEWKIEMEK